MHRIVKSEKLPIKLWLDDIEDGAMAQVLNLANYPYAFSHVAIMPDAHCGYGMPIGGVLATKDVIIPNAVGVDIGCGMCAIRTSLTDISTEKLKAIMSDIRNVVPLGFKHHKKAQDINLMPQNYNIKKMFIARKEYESALHQIGTLGGGNHFIEMQKGSDGYIWIMVHSGSRNIGLKVANHYNIEAKNISSELKEKIPRQFDLACLPTKHEIGRAYMNEMNFCLEFAKANRDLIMTNIKKIFCDHSSCTFDSFINIHHNYAALEKHFSQEVFIHRKGATSARAGQLGIIPGSQGSTSYIVEGKGNPDSFCSCSHGAGRKMGRKQAKRILDLNHEINKLDKQGILHSIRTQNDLDEASSAYKDIDRVMEFQEDLVKIKIKLQPLAVIKG